MRLLSFVLYFPNISVYFLMAAIVIEIGVSAKDPCAHSIYNLSLSRCLELYRVQRFSKVQYQGRLKEF